MASFFTVGGSLFLMAAYALYQAIDAARWGETSRFRKYLVASLVLCLLTGGALWVGIAYPDADYWGDPGGVAPQR
jgi:hypothetical protein